MTEYADQGDLAMAIAAKSALHELFSERVVLNWFIQVTVGISK